MIKQELIGILEGLEGDSFIEKYNEGYDQAVRDCLIAVKQLDEHERVIVPKFVAIELDKLKDKYLTLRELYAGDVNWLNDGTFYLEGKELELAGWVNKNETTFEYAWIHGYEVEKESLYEVIFMEADGERYLLAELGESYFEIIPESENDGYRSQWFTEQEIKAIDERYWPFAVKVDGE